MRVSALEVEFEELEERARQLGLTARLSHMPDVGPVVEFHSDLLPGADFEGYLGWTDSPDVARAFLQGYELGYQARRVEEEEAARRLEQVERAVRRAAP